MLPDGKHSLVWLIRYKMPYHSIGAMHFTRKFNLICFSGKLQWNRKPVSHLAELLKILGLYFCYRPLGRRSGRHSFTRTSKEELMFLFPNLYWKANCKSFSSGALPTKSSLHVYPCWMTPKLSPPYNSF